MAVSTQLTIYGRFWSRAFHHHLKKQQMIEFLVEKGCRIPPIEFQNLCQGALKMFWLVVAQLLIKTLYVGVSFILEVTCRSELILYA
jgi:hypothetical protein